MICLCIGVMGSVTVWSPWSAGSTPARGRCHGKGRAREACHGCLGCLCCRARESVSVNLYETSVCPPDFVIRASVGSGVARVAGTNAGPPDSVSPVVGVSGRPPFVCVRGNGGGCPC